MTLLAALIAVPAAAQAPLSEPVSGEWLVGAFKRFCVEPFGDRTRLVAAVEGGDGGFTRIEEGPSAPGTSGWESARARIVYSDGAWLPKSLPSPQCVVTATPAAGYDHGAAATALAAALGLPPGKTRGKKDRFQTEWNFSGPKGEKRRVFLSREPSPTGPRLRASLLNLR